MVPKMILTGKVEVTVINARLVMDHRSSSASRKSIDQFSSVKYMVTTQQDSPTSNIRDSAKTTKIPPSV